MAKNSPIKTKPWCPFCGQDVDQPVAAQERKLNEFTMGTCQCGALYTCDPTGFNVGSAMVECLVHACNDNWDLAWELFPEDDYLSGRVENYDELTNQVVETQNLDGRKIKGVLYFIRLHQAAAEIVAHATPTERPRPVQAATRKGFQIPLPEAVRDPKRVVQRASKTMVQELVEAGDITTLVDLTFDDSRTLRFIQRMLYDPREEKRWFYAHIFAQVCSRYATQKPGAVSDLLHRLFEACTDSAAAHWGLLETVGAIIAARPDIFGGFAKHLLMFRTSTDSHIQVLWGLGSIAAKRPELIKNMQYYSLFKFIEHPNVTVKGHAIRLFGALGAQEVRSQIEPYLNDHSPLIVYEQGLPQPTSLALLARAALAAIPGEGAEKNEQ